MPTIPELATPQRQTATLRDGVDLDLGIPLGNYAGVLERRWGLVTPFHKRNIGFKDLSRKDLVTMSRLYIDFPGMTKAEILSLPVSSVSKQFLQGFAEGNPYILMLLSEISYQRPEKLQAQPVHEDYAVFNTTGENLKPITIMGTVYNTPLDPWARYMDALWVDLFRASKLARHKARLRLYTFDKMYYVMPATIGFAFRANSQDIASLQIQGFAWKVLSVAPVLQTVSVASSPVIPKHPTGENLTQAESKVVDGLLLNLGEGLGAKARILSATSERG